MSRIHRYPRFEPEMLQSLEEEMDDIFRRLETLESKRVVTMFSVVNTTETEIRHMLGRKPEFTVTPRGDARVWETRDATDTSIYLRASSQVTVKLQLR